MEIISEKFINPLYMRAGNTLSVIYTDVVGIVHDLDTIAITESQIIDKIAFFKIKDEHGFSAGIGAIMGKSI